MTETAFILNTFFLMFCGCLVMFMAAGFAMLEAGTVRSKSVGTILVKNIGLYAIAGIMFFLCGYNLMYANVDGGFWGTLSIWSPDDSAALETGDYSAGSASAAGWFFQMVFVATACSIVSGALAERIKLWPFFIFCAVLTGFIYPITGSWSWGGGWLSEMGFKDFAGSPLLSLRFVVMGHKSTGQSMFEHQEHTAYHGTHFMDCSIYDTRGDLYSFRRVPVSIQRKTIQQIRQPSRQNYRRYGKR